MLCVGETHAIRLEIISVWIPSSQPWRNDIVSCWNEDTSLKGLEFGCDHPNSHLGLDQDFQSLLCTLSSLAFIIFISCFYWFICLCTVSSLRLGCHTTSGLRTGVYCAYVEKNEWGMTLKSCYRAGFWWIKADLEFSRSDLPSSYNCFSVKSSHLIIPVIQETLSFVSQQKPTFSFKGFVLKRATFEVIMHMSK